MLHQAEDEIAAAGVAIGASYAGKVALTITSGPGLALKTEFIGLAVMTETPLVVVDVQRGGPSTGLPTKVEQSDLLAVLYGQPGDAPKVVLAPATIEECFHVMVTARRIAEAFRMRGDRAVGREPRDGRAAVPASGARRALDARGARPGRDVPPGTKPYDWDPQHRTVAPASSRDSRTAMYTLTGLEHDNRSKVAYSGGVHQHSSAMRSRKLAVLQSMLLPPAVHGDDAGDLLVVGWGSTKGAIEEAVDRAARGRAARVVAASDVPLAAAARPARDVRAIQARMHGGAQLQRRARRAVHHGRESPRCGQLAWLLRAHDAGGRGLLDARAGRAAPARRDRRRDPRAGSTATTCRRCRMSVHDACRCCALLHAPTDDDDRSLELSRLRGRRRHAGVPAAATTRCSPRWSGCSSPSSSARSRRCSSPGIGCSSRFPHYLKTYGFHGIHGRALPVATGIKLHRPDLTVFVVMGDGDCTSIGAGHWMHAMRYNVRMVAMLLDNGIYGLTKNQTSPTTPQGLPDQHAAARQLPAGAQPDRASRSA